MRGVDSRLATLLIVLSAAHTHCASALKARLPVDMASWRVGEYDDTFERFWDRDLVRAGALGNNYEQLRPLFEKLDRREPILVLGMGSSLMEALGAPFSSAPLLLARRV